MKLLIGLGNPGIKYLKNRHNVGHMFVDSIHSSQITAIKTNCFMNDSGKFVKKIVSSEQEIGNNLYIAHDDLDLKLGTYKIQFGVGPKVHNGVASVENELGTKDFWRIRIGIDNRTDSGQVRMTGEEYVLQDFTDKELEILKQVQDDIKKELYEKVVLDIK